MLRPPLSWTTRVVQVKKGRQLSQMSLS